MQPVDSVDTLPCATLADFAAYERSDRPVVLAGAVRHWPAVTRWNPDYLKQKLGRVEIQYKLSSSNAHPDFRKSTLPEMFARGRAPFGDFLDAITIGPGEDRARKLFTGDEQFLLQRRKGQTTLHPQLRVLLDDVETPLLVPPARLYTIWSWFSAAGVRTWLHYDNNGCHNLNAQITGRKECVLFEPRDLPRLYPFTLGGPNPAHNCCRVDVEHPDPERFPEFAAARGWRATLQAGDLLFIPAGWFHTFLHTGPFNSNVNFWWKPEHPRLNPVAARQSLLDTVSAAGIDTRDPTTAALLQRLDEAAIARRD